VNHDSSDGVNDTGGDEIDIADVDLSFGGVVIDVR
jgi:hypothetical protein